MNPEPMNTIQVFERNVYGKQTIYPTGQHAGSIERLTRRKTLTMSELQTLQALGHKVEFVHDPASTMTRYTLNKLAA